MKHIEFAQIGFLHPILSGLESSGVNLTPLVRRAGIEAFDLQDPECYIPFHLYEGLLEQIHHRHGIPDLASEFQEKLHISSCAEWGEMLARRSSMLSVCQKAVKFPNVVFTNQRMRIETHGKISKFEQWFANPGTSGRRHVVDIDNALTLNTFKNIIGDDWEPIEVHIQSDTAFDITQFFPNAKRTRVRTGMPTSAVILDTHLLAQNGHGSEDLASVTEQDFSPPRSVADKVEILLRHTLPGVVPSIREVALMLNTSERSLRRALAEEACTFAELVDNWRREEALKKIHEGRFQIDEIADFLGYLNPPAFFRAFKRWTNFSPNRYRDLDPDFQIQAMAS
ncbi:helix-turn-helix transcriptional regulator [Pelagicoccus mobilis]|uniref:AraC family transcriptional regulator ligand-binding domain-containing protein n=1 Tax=Pelagicoccus mobilis TaxID=415221 RepID=A0A934RZG4_9BACT|nr:AraC family transcriptional regulator [Pelagicoccus mobilis]MBK1879148.1 AraC family transcriptional regulator ligand-binding domain-containing protein [Pelagicoccus mobilis]